MQSMRTLFDTNILLDLAMEGRPDHVEALKAASACVDGRLQGCVLATSLKDFYYIARRSADDACCRAFVRAFTNIFEVLPLDLVTCEHALDLPEPDLEDAMVLSAAMLAGVDIICTRDARAFRGFSGEVESAKELMEELS